MDIAMEGSSPFVITDVIVCGCGTQVLSVSETVQGWIKSTSQVCNAPKNHFNWDNYCHAFKLTQEVYSAPKNQPK